MSKIRRVDFVLKPATHEQVAKQLGMSPEQLLRISTRIIKAREALVIEDNGSKRFIPFRTTLL
ncbi:hypothetical protein KKC08_03235 [Patescibacteria group bacterium]|nr:hypothetical protein [Patescibacteria group bacterium]MCG2702517.1 hypothetical protein [Candidatus Parcubacteria bacterium]MBU4265058.1 hypothetical protein [Patescibacteria group bacterium]MBU4390267.1 hypothetical protein [Patescibacteria group bacterium]MBU4397153.1 hypothetical protein [Patescibacteria group bacterium]